jgi:Tol biopolymer transport system component
VAFESIASNLVASDANGATDVFVRDLKTKVTTRVSVRKGNAASSGGGSNPSISANGQRIAFQSSVSDLIRNDTNGSLDVFVWKAATKRITRVSVGPNGIQSDLPPVPRPAYGGERESFDAAISGDGRSVAFASTATNLVTDDTNGVGDIFVHDLTTSVTRRVSLTSAGQQVTTGFKGSGSFSPSISHDGKVVAFLSNSYSLVPNASHLHQIDSYVVNLNTGVMRRVEKTFDGAETARGADSPSVSPDGRFVLFSSSDANVVSGDTNANSDVFVRDLRTGRTRLVSVGRHGAQADGGSGNPVASSGAAVVAFDSTATNLVANDTNGVNDIFTRG